jgi:hypothetical protein
MCGLCIAKERPVTIQVGRQLRIDEDILGFGDDQLCSLIWFGILALDRATGEDREHLLGRLRMLRVEVERRDLLGEETLRKFDERIAR